MTSDRAAANLSSQKGSEDKMNKKLNFYKTSQLSP